jgi:LysR family glycine cleavage system transcriptional activator
MKLPPLTALRAFEAASRHGSLSAAARELNVTHAAIAQQVKKLEEWFGVSLMQRAGRGVEATARGARLAEGLGEGFTAMQRAVEALSVDDATRALKITLTPTFATNWLLPRLGGFRAAHPEIEIMLNPTAQPIDLIAEDYDVAFRFGAGEWAGLSAELIVDGGHAVFAAVSLLEGRKVETPADVAALPWVQELGMDERGVWLKAHGIEETGPRNVLHMPGNLVVDAIRRGEGVGNVGRTWFEDDVAAGSVVTLFDDDTTSDLGYWVVSRPGPARPPLKAFLRWVRAELAA